MNDHTIYLTSEDSTKLRDLVEALARQRNGIDRVAMEMLGKEIGRAVIVAPNQIPADVVTMNSRTQVRDLDTNEVMTLTVSWPGQADSKSGRVNVLAPLGMALLGARTGDVIEWPVPAGQRRLRIEAVVFQPESASVLDADSEST